jgi:hypothetical protein
VRLDEEALHRGLRIARGQVQRVVVGEGSFAGEGRGRPNAHATSESDDRAGVAAARHQEDAVLGLSEKGRDCVATEQGGRAHDGNDRRRDSLIPELGPEL